MKTIRRDKLLRLAKAGKLVAVDCYSFDDLTGESRGTKEKPVEVIPQNRDEWVRKENVFYVHEHAFTSDVGRAWDNGNGTVHLYVHSNCSFDFRIV